jgi:chorismate mutase/prephenate dehydrogenase
VARRAEVAKEIGFVKDRDGTPVRDRAREKKVIELFSKKARAVGLSKEMAEDLAGMLISDSLRIQKSRRTRQLATKKAVVVGGAGHMGEWTCRFLSNRGADVVVWDPRARLKGYSNIRSLRPAATEADIVVVASPLGACLNDLREVLDASPKGLVFDLCSVKAHLAAELRGAVDEGTLACSVHPMFGPGAPSPEGRNVLICDCGSERAVDLAYVLFSGAGAHVSLLSLERHDELMAYVLGLSHLCVLLFAETLGESGTDLSKFNRARGPSFERLVQMARELTNESRRVYHDIQALNPNTRDVISTMETALKKLKSASLDDDPEKFRTIMDSDMKYLEVE